MLKPSKLSRFVSILASLLVCGTAFAQAGPSDDARRAFAARLDAGDATAVKVTKDDGGHVHYVRTSQPNGFNSPVDTQGLTALTPERAADLAADRFVRVMATEFGLPQDVQMSLRRYTETPNRRHVRYQQTLNNLPVFGGEMLVELTSRNGVLSVRNDTLTGDAAGMQRLSAAADLIGRDGAAAAASAVLEWELDGASLEFDAGKLVIYAPTVIGNKGAPCVAWQFDVRATDRFFAEQVFVDAATGEVVLRISRIHDAKNRNIYNTNGSTTFPPTSPTLARTEGAGVTGVTDVDNAYDYLGDTYDFYNSIHGRDSINGAGLTLIAYTYYHYSQAVNNAFWYNGAMYFYDGFTVDDVTAHELTHGVTEYTSGLVYLNQSGALNESFSDMWGEWIDQNNGKGTDGSSHDWRMGEDIPSIGVIRNMKNPPEFGDPDRMNSPYYYTGTGDSGGVHTNSGVANKLCYLLTDGDTFNGQTITGLGYVAAAQLMYYTQVNLLTSGVTYEDFGYAVYDAAVALGYTGADLQNIANAVIAVEMVLSFTEPNTVVFSDNFNSDPNWTKNGLWAFGVPTGNGAVDGFGNPDPTSGFDGSNVHGTNLGGDYGLSDFSLHVAVTPLIDLTGVTGSRLVFYRWLNMDWGSYCHVSIQASTDGLAWDTLWENPASDYTTDSAWTEITVNLSAYDNSPHLFIRWTQQLIRADAFRMSGWNIDNVSVVGVTDLSIDAPSGLEVVSDTANTADLTWLDNSDNETEFRVYRRPVPEVPAVNAEAQSLAAKITTTASPARAFIQGEVVPPRVGQPLNSATTDSASLIDLDLYRADPRFSSYNGAGIAVAVLDTGIDVNHSFFGPDADTNGIADRIVFNYDFYDNDSDATDTNGHGSNVASIVGSQDATYTGMAPECDIVALRVLGTDGSGTFTMMENALQWIVANHSTYNIKVVNMSIGDGGNYTTAQALYGISDELAALKAAGVAVVVSSGNSFYGYSSAVGVGYPSADASALSIGAVYDGSYGSYSYGSGAIAYTTGADRLTPFSQRHSTLSTMFAPGAPITGANYNGGTVTQHGTSQASPHIAGILALMQQLAYDRTGSYLTVDECIDLLRNNADFITDGDDENDNVTNTSLTFPRVNVFAMAEAIDALAGWELVATLAADATSYQDTTVTGGEVYEYYVTAANADAESDPSNTVQVTIAAAGPTGSLTVTIEPQGAIDAGAQWSIDGGTTYKDSGTTLTNVAVGDYTITFKSVTGWDTPANQSATISEDATTTKTGTYVQQVGSLTVTLAPQGAIDAGATWSIDGGTTPQSSGTTLTGLPIGDYTVTYKTVAGYTTPSNQTATVTKNTTTTKTGTYLLQVGSISVTIAPQGAIDAGAQWSIDAGSTWRDSGTSVSSLPIGVYTVTYKSAPGYDTPSDQSATVTNGATTSKTGTYIQQVGSLTVTISPAGAVTAGAKWSIDGGTTFHDSGATVSSLPIGDYTVSFKTVAGWDTPGAQSATITKDTETSKSGTYVQQFGNLTVTLSPQEAIDLGARWSIDGGNNWNASGATLTGLPVASYTLSFDAVGSWTTPASQTIAITKNATTNATGVYLEESGSVTVTLLPQAAIDAGAMWSVDGGTTWNASGSTATTGTGSIPVIYSAATRFLSPEAASVTVVKNANTPTSAVYLELRGDFNGDGRSDAVTQNDAGGTRILITASASVAPVAAGSEGIASFGESTDLDLLSVSSWTVRGVGDFNDDGRSDLVVQDSTGAVCILEQDGSGNFGSTLKWIYHGALAGWSVRGAADLDGDGDPDLVLQQANGAVALWYIQNETLASSAFLFQNALPGWFVKGSGDFDGDGDADLVLQYSDGRRAFWYLQNGTLASGVFLTAAADPDWQVRDVLSTSGTTVVLVEQNTNTRVVRLHTIENNASSGTTTLDTTPGYGQQVVAAGPLTTGASPILFMADASTSMHIWTIASSSFKAAAAEGAGIASLGVTDSGTATLAELKDQRVFGVVNYPGTSSFDYLWQDSAGRIGKTDNNTYSPLSNSWVSTATTTKVAVGTGDMDLDGLADIIFRDSDGTISIQYLTGNNSTLAFGSSATIITGLGDWSVAAVGQLGNSNSSADLILQHSSGAVVFWEMANTAISNSGFIFGGSLPGWSVRALTDMGSTSGGAPDGQTDLVLRHSGGTVAVWFLNSGSYTIGGSAFVNLDLSGKLIVASGLLKSSTQDDLLLQKDDGSCDLTIQAFTNHTPGATEDLTMPALSADSRTMIGSGDFDGDGNLDLVWTTGSLQIGISLLDTNGDATNTFWLNSTAYAGWSAVGVTDFDSDGNADIMIRDSSGTVALWRYEGITRSGGYFLTSALADWDPVGTGDLDGDGGTDLLLQNRSNGDLVVWYYKNLIFTGAGSYLLTDLGTLNVKAVGDFDGDRVYDLLLEDPATGDITLRPLDGSGTAFTLPAGYTPRAL